MVKHESTNPRLVYMLFLPHSLDTETPNLDSKFQAKQREGSIKWRKV